MHRPFHITQEHSSENIKSNYFLKNQKIISHDKTKNYDCHLCNKSFKDFVRLKKHKKSDSHLKKKDAKRNPIRDHEKVQKKVPKIENKQLKIIHEEIIIDEFKDCLDDFTEKNFSRSQPCQFCDDYFPNPNDLTSHMCPGRQEAMKESLENKSKMCDNELFTCEYCPGFWTCDLSRLNKHNRTKAHQKKMKVSTFSNIFEICNNFHEKILNYYIRFHEILLFFRKNVELLFLKKKLLIQ